VQQVQQVAVMPQIAVADAGYNCGIAACIASRDTGFVDHSFSGAVKTMQRTSMHFKISWSQYCQAFGQGREDPSRHDDDFHISFLNAVALQACEIAGMNPAASGDLPPAEQQAKRARSDVGLGVGVGVAGGLGGGMGVGGGGCGGGMDVHTCLVNAVKNYMRVGVEQKDLWCTYADTYLRGTRDPARHTAEVLNEFCVNHNVHVDTTGLAVAGAAGAGMGVVVAPPPAPVQQHLAALPAPPPAPVHVDHIGIANAAPVHTPQVVLPPTHLQNHNLNNTLSNLNNVGLGVAPAVAANDPHAQLVQAVKNFARVGQPQKDLWCTYADTYLRGVRDPARHNVAILQEFCVNHNVPVGIVA